MPSSRRGRPRAGEHLERRRAVLEAALAELTESGLERTTMQAVAARAGSSKESLYTWFGNRQGLLAALVEQQSAATNAAVKSALDDPADPVAALTTIATGLLRLLVGPASVALNRASMSSPELAALLLRHGRHTTGPLVEAYLESLHQRGFLVASDPAETFQLFYGLVVRDWQIRVLLGEEPPGIEQIDDEARVAVSRLITLVGAAESDA
ncbi:TetR/AcrR family transcriptional regulator [Cryptosporangium aurantiacum]|uniref:Transcriptional regulator, TetR family n=1 Tax=Cryptosporangium aurantiacum TaxID=134849 RepID=A0A1M7R2V6_9ACTN|nr:TetR/AcrR family transcriptional regulator [Cryptosporangium aurantiacum]SHN39118.1 transcriptional regulator, TetR family [Cryptosporangium aurantiacum]